MRKALLLLTGTLALSACAYPSPKLVAQLDSLKGRPEADLIREMGVPSRTYDSSGHRFLAFSRSRIDSIPGTPGFYPYGWGYWGGWGGYGWGGWGGGIGPQIVQRDCEITFDLAAGTVQSWTLRGNDC